MSIILQKNNLKNSIMNIILNNIINLVLEYLSLNEFNLENNKVMELVKLFECWITSINKIKV
jgi:hypothetical protein